MGIRKRFKRRVSNFQKGVQVLSNVASGKTGASKPTRVAAAVATTGLGLVPVKQTQPARAQVQKSASKAVSRGGASAAAGYAAGLFPATTTQAAIDVGAGPAFKAASVAVRPIVKTGFVGGTRVFGKAAQGMNKVDNLVTAAPRATRGLRGALPYIGGGVVAGTGLGIAGGTASNIRNRSTIQAANDYFGALIGTQEETIGGLQAENLDLRGALQGLTQAPGAEGEGFLEDFFGDPGAPFFGEGSTFGERFESMPLAGKIATVGGIGVVANIATGGKLASSLGLGKAKAASSASKAGGKKSGRK